jgi:hypothetical protein
MEVEMRNIGFVFALLGCAGLAEAYGDGKQIAISLALIGVGALMMREKNETSNQHRDIDSRPYFLS